MKTFKPRDFFFSMFLALFLCIGVAGANEFMICNFSPSQKDKSFKLLKSTFGEETFKCNAFSCELAFIFFQQHDEHEKDITGKTSIMTLKGVTLHSGLVSADIENHNIDHLVQISGTGNKGLDFLFTRNPKDATWVLVINSYTWNEIPCHTAITMPQIAENPHHYVNEKIDIDNKTYFSRPPYDFSSDVEHPPVVGPGFVSPPLEPDGAVIHMPTTTAYGNKEEKKFHQEY